MKFLELFDLLLEANYNYTIPTDKEKLLFDFYTLEAVDRYPELDGATWKLREHFQERQAIKYIKNKLLPFLKQELLDSAFFSIASELRHAMPDPEKSRKGNASRLNGRGLDHMGYNAPDKYEDELEKLVREFHDERLRLGGANSRSGIKDRQIAAAAAENLSFSREEFVNLAEYIFNELDWEEEYGGEAWGKIAAAWKKLNEAKGEDLYIWIDHMFSQQHNSGNVLDKLEEYRKAGHHRWITRALDLKFDANDPWKLWRKSSRDLQRLGSVVLMAKGYGSAEDFVKNVHKGQLSSNAQRDLSPTVLTPSEVIRDSMKNGNTEKVLRILDHQKANMTTRLPPAALSDILELPEPASQPMNADYSKQIEGTIKILGDKRFQEIVKSSYDDAITNMSGRLRALFSYAASWHLRNNDIRGLLKAMEKFILDIGGDKGRVEAIIRPHPAGWMSTAAWLGEDEQSKDDVLANLISLLEATYKYRSGTHTLGKIGNYDSDLLDSYINLLNVYSHEELKPVKAALVKLGYKDIF